MSSPQGIVIPPIGCSYPNCSSVWLSHSWNEVWLKYDTGITNLFIFSPTYTARYPFGTPFEDDAFDLMILVPFKQHKSLASSSNSINLSSLPCLVFASLRASVAARQAASKSVPVPKGYVAVYVGEKQSRTGM
ncbi:SAUR-like auxin-responsive family protein [Trifolium pratense]|uniref:SAUR-like auxin-responsive family protein n=1 Tax=Trifolium pratense TaxID=57577 RepID=A0A2K3M276_TRIPR|nr:SAUR-like auxin-responsive family protein [Trifolium pratense]